MTPEQIVQIVRDEVKRIEERKTIYDSFYRLCRTKHDMIVSREHERETGKILICITPYDKHTMRSIDKAMSLTVKRMKELGVYPY